MVPLNKCMQSDASKAGAADARRYDFLQAFLEQ